MAAATPTSSGPLFLSIVRSEFIKFRTVRSTLWCLLGTVVLFLAFAFIGCPVVASQWDGWKPEQKADFMLQGPASFSLTGGALAQIAVGVLGILAITGEYGSGSIRTTLAAAPQRRLVVLAKSLVVALPTGLLALVAAFAAFFVGQSFLDSAGIAVGIGDDPSLRMIFGAAIYLAITAIFGMGIGSLIRHTGGSITAFVGILFVLPGLMQLVPEDIRNQIYKYLPGSSGQAIFNAHQLPDSLAPWAGLGVYAIWGVLSVVLSVWLIQRRDA